MKKILHFEDDVFLSQIYNKVFKQYGFDCVTYEHPTKDPVSLVLKEKPALIITDVIMPILDGFAATQLLKADMRTKDIPIIGFCNMGMPEDIKKGLSLGMSEYWVMAHYRPYQVVQKVCEFLKVPCPPKIEEHYALSPLLVPRPWFWRLVAWFKR